LLRQAKQRAAIDGDFEPQGHEPPARSNIAEQIAAMEGVVPPEGIRGRKVFVAEANSL
jgi:hypothetical protein